MRFFVNCTADRFASEDLVQNTFEKMVKYRKNYRGRGSFKAWLFSIARNVLKDSFRKNSRSRLTTLEDQDPIHDAPGVEEAVIAQDRQRMLRLAMDQLSPEKREMLTLVKLEGMKYREVAEIFDIKESTLKVNIFRILKQLKKNIEALQAQGY